MLAATATPPLAALNRGLQLHPDDVNLCLAMAQLELKAGKPNEAATVLDQGRKALADKAAIRITPICSTFWRKLVCNRADTGRGD